MSCVAHILSGKAAYVQAEPLMRRALAIFFTSLGAAHPNTVTVRSNCRALLGKMNLSASEIADRMREVVGEE